MNSFLYESKPTSYGSSIMPNTHRWPCGRRRRDSTGELRRVGGVYRVNKIDAVWLGLTATHCMAPLANPNEDGRKTLKNLRYC